jgi:hypothetical protein
VGESRAYFTLLDELYVMFTLFGIEKQREKQGRRNGLLHGLPISKQELCIPQKRFQDAANSCFFPWQSYVPDVRAIWVCGKLGHEHALPVDVPIISDAVFAFWLRT